MARTTSTTETSFAAQAGVPSANALNGLQAVFDLPYTVFNFLKEWQARHEARLQLRTMDDHQLADIGMTHAERDKEVAKFF